MNPLKDLFLEELADRYDAEQRLVRAMPKMAKAANCKNLRKLIDSHLKQTIGHVKKLEKVFKSFGAKVKARKCEATIGLLKEGDELAADFKGTPAIDAALISLAQKVEHYEIASYGCLREWSALLGDKNASGLLNDILEEEKVANHALIDIARFSSNTEALGECGPAGSCNVGKSVKPVKALRSLRPVKLKPSRPVLI